MLECDEFYGLGPDQVASLIASDTITVPNEEKVMWAVERGDEEMGGLRSLVVRLWIQVL